MNTDQWQITGNNGFLSTIEPMQQWESLRDALPEIIADMPDRQGAFCKLKPDQHPDADMIRALVDHCRKTPGSEEIVFNFLTYLASALVGTGHRTIPAYISIPLCELATKLDRPPMLSYSGMVLNNWRLKDEAQGFVPHNIDLLFRFTDLVDESWFFQVHIAIEAQAGQMLQAMRDVQSAIAKRDKHAVLIQIRKMQKGLVQITKTFHEMPALCDADVYFQDVRPYLMSFGEEIIFEGITPNPSPLRGGSGAQSSIVPAMLAGLGIGHRESELTANLQDMRRYMPREHRDFIAEMNNSQLRTYCADYAPLKDAYNHVLRQLITFRRAHLYYARTYIFEKSTNPVGTGGTAYMSFLSKLIDETGEQLL